MTGRLRPRLAGLTRRLARAGAAVGRLVADDRAYIEPLFDRRWYLEAYPDVATSGTDPLDHYLKYGWREGRAPGPLFNPAAYLWANPDVAAAGVEPLGHYLRHGRTEGRPLGVSVAAGELVRALYRQLLERDADPQGYAYHLDAIARTGDLDRLVHEFALARGGRRPFARLQSSDHGRATLAPDLARFRTAATARTAQLLAQDAMLAELLHRPLVYP